MLGRSPRIPQAHPHYGQGCASLCIPLNSQGPAKRRRTFVVTASDARHGVCRGSECALTFVRLVTGGDACRPGVRCGCAGDLLQGLGSTRRWTVLTLPLDTSGGRLQFRDSGPVRVAKKGFRAYSHFFFHPRIICELFRDELRSKIETVHPIIIFVDSVYITQSGWLIGSLERSNQTHGVFDS